MAHSAAQDPPQRPLKTFQWPPDRRRLAAEVAVSRRSPEGGGIELATLGPGQSFGEIGILAETRRTASVRAIDDVELFVLKWGEFQTALEESDSTDRDFSEIVQERLANAPAP
jgi:CRP-like cAMP-binding protein